MAASISPFLDPSVDAVKDCRPIRTRRPWPSLQDAIKKEDNKTVHKIVNELLRLYRLGQEKDSASKGRLFLANREMDGRNAAFHRCRPTEKKEDYAEQFQGSPRQHTSPNVAASIHDRPYNGRHYCCELKQALYGLAPSARIWYDTMSAKMQDLASLSAILDNVVHDQVIR